MDFLNSLNCPQYVNFNSDMPKGNSVLEASPGYYLKDCTKNENTGTVDENTGTVDENSYSVNEQSYSDSLQSTPSESYLAGNSPHGSVTSVASSYQAEDYPINRPKNLSLPEKAAKKNTKVNKTTKVEPFHFTRLKKRKRETEESDHVPLAEQVAAFYKTPQRFHTVGSKVFEPTQHWSPEIVHPKSPNLRAAKRHRKVDILSREEQENIEAEEIKRYQFRARPINRSILHQPRLHQIVKKTPTKRKSFHLRTAKRAAEIHAKKKEEEKPYEFHARPVPKKILSGPTGLKEKTSLPVTEAKTPNFALKSRAAKWKSENKLNETVEETQKFKALPAPAPSSPFIVKHEKKRTEIQPFSFDSRDKELMSKKLKKVQEEIEKENAVYVFKAQLMPSDTPSRLPEVPKKLPTLPQPFNFQLEGRGSKHNSFNLSFDQACPVFKAQPATVLEKPPFIPEKPAKKPVEIQEFHLHTENRASERLKLKEINDMKEHEKELARQRFREIQEEEERREIQKMRKEAVHKANPIRQYKPVEIKPSSKPPTEPLSPKFKTDERLQLRH